ncbi:uncharacterized protein LOC116208847 [Punica granatum]|uniref:Uncharacterized protein LOC116208847 n=1 Tax=Punica granatum TaxID=22663 RepID=A0A6P8DYJ2_PUNGR|nr:uncharacterized protein LOC116208847 [Punica granatum]
MSVLLSAQLQNPSPRIALHFPRPPAIRSPGLILPIANSHFHIVQHRALLRWHGGFASNMCRVRAYSSDGSVYGENKNAPGNFGVDSFLSIVESLCLLSSAAVSIVLAVRRSVFGGFGDRVLVWVVVVLICGVAIGSLVRIRQWRRFFNQSVKSGGGRDLNLVERVEKLEEDLRSSATIIRGLSRQLEKLGIRFRLTRKALTEPIAETAALAQKNSEATRALAAQEDILEKELGEIQKVLLAMQEQQQKQLELILVIGKTSKLWDSRQEPVEHRHTNETLVSTEEDGKPVEVHQTQA